MPFNVENIVRERVMSKASNFINESIGNVSSDVSGAIGAASDALNSLQNVSNVKELVTAKIGMLKALAGVSKPQILNGLKSGADTFIKSFDPGSIIPESITTKVVNLESFVSTLQSQVASLLPP